MRPAHWLPPVFWMGVILALSSDTGSAEQTTRLLLPLLQWLLPWATPAQLDPVHLLARKTGHLVEYAVLAALWFRAFARGRGLAPRASSWLALAISLAWAFLDEWHQSTLFSRTGSAWDVAIDGVGAVAALAAARLGWRAAVDLATAILLWIAAIGGAAVLAVNAFTGVASGILWLTAPAAAAGLLARRLRARRRPRGPKPDADRNAKVGSGRASETRSFWGASAITGSGAGRGAGETRSLWASSRRQPNGMRSCSES